MTDTVIPPSRRIYCNRTLNLRSIKAIGYDMDYTLVHYHADEWEQRVYRHVQDKLAARGWPLDGLAFEAEFVIRGLVLDTALGNMVKADRFGYVKRACHGTGFLSFDEQRSVYSRTTIDLGDERFVFLNTLFSLSEACIYLQCVDLLDAGQLPEPLGYRDLFRYVTSSVSETHVEGQLKAEIIDDPDRFVQLDPDLPQAVLDQRDAGRRLVLITNSEWTFTKAMMHYAFDRFLPPHTTWRDIFPLAIVSARKPHFFTDANPLFRVVDEEGLLRPAPRGIEEPGIYLGGSASDVETYLGVSGDEILYVGDHMFTDVHVSKSILRWRTGLVLRELEDDLEALGRFEPEQTELSRLMAEKATLEHRVSTSRLEVQRRRVAGQDRQSVGGATVDELRHAIRALDERIGPLAAASSTIGNRKWGQLMRAGNDKSHLARQVERYADIYTSRVSNFLHSTPFAYLRAPRGSLPHDPE